MRMIHSVQVEVVYDKCFSDHMINAIVVQGNYVLLSRGHGTADQDSAVNSSSFCSSSVAGSR